MKTMTAAEFDANPAAARERARKERVVIEAEGDLFELHQLVPPHSPRSQEELEAMLLEGLKGPFVPFDEAMVNIRQRLKQRHQA